MRNQKFHCIFVLINNNKSNLIFTMKSGHGVIIIYLKYIVYKENTLLLLNYNMYYIIVLS